MEEYINQRKELYESAVSFLENDQESGDDYEQLKKDFDIFRESNNHERLKEILILISKISKNHFRTPAFMHKIEKIILDYQDEIIQNFSNLKIYKIFKGNRKLLLFLIENKILTLDKEIVDSNFISKNGKFFYPEIKDLMDASEKQEIEEKILRLDPKYFDNYEEKRRKGENDSPLCELIRNDSVVDFISYVDKFSINLSGTINQSIYETNSFLVKSFSVKIIEYVSFYGAIQIFQYLMMNEVKLYRELYFFAIHGRNSQILHILEENINGLNDQNYIEFLKESIKCHHNDFANYFLDNFIGRTIELDRIKNDFLNNSISYALKYYNFDDFQTIENYDFLFIYACRFDYMELVQLLFKIYDVNVNLLLIFNFYFSNEVF